MQVNYETALKIKRHYESKLVGEKYKGNEFLKEANPIIERLYIIPDEIRNKLAYKIEKKDEEKVYYGDNLWVMATILIKSPLKDIRHAFTLEDTLKGMEMEYDYKGD